METQNQDVAHSPAEVPNDPGKMFIGGLSWQTSPGKSPKDTETSGSSRFVGRFSPSRDNHACDALFGKMCFRVNLNC